MSRRRTLDSATAEAAASKATAAKGVHAPSARPTTAAEPGQATRTDRIPSGSRRCVVRIPSDPERVVVAAAAAAVGTGEEGIVKGGMHTPAHVATGSRKAAAADEGAAQGVVGT